MVSASHQIIAVNNVPPTITFVLRYFDIVGETLKTFEVYQDQYRHEINARNTKLVNLTG